ncbi:G-protein coupled receptor 54-like [Littorina saxatilis]
MTTNSRPPLLPTLPSLTTQLSIPVFSALVSVTKSVTTPVVDAMMSVSTETVLASFVSSTPVSSGYAWMTVSSRGLIDAASSGRAWDDLNTTTEIPWYRGSDTTSAPTNCTTELTDNSTYYDYERSAMVHALWVSIIVLGALGNGLVIYTMGRHGERSATNCYIINLAVSDFAVLTIVVPFTIAMFTSFDWLYGETMCKATVYLIYVTLQATCLTLTAMTIDRYFAIVHPIASLKDRTLRAAVVICVASWLAASFVCIPFIVYSRLEYQSEPSGDHVYCVNQWPSPTWMSVVNIAFVMSTYVIPLSVIIVSYTLILKHLWKNKIGIRREMPPAPGGPEVGVAVGPVARRRRKVAKMVFAVVLVFAVTWLPIHVFNLCLTLIDPFPRTEVMYNVKIMCHTLSYLNSCLNPFIYAFLGDGFRRAFRKSFPRCTMRNQVVPGVPHEAGPSTTAETRLAGNAREHTRNICQETSPLPPIDN